MRSLLAAAIFLGSALFAFQNCSGFHGTDVGGGTSLASSVAVTSTPAAGARFATPFALANGQSVSKGAVSLTLNPNGQLLLTKGSQVLWSSAAGPSGCGDSCQAVFSADGHITLSNNGSSYWQSPSPTRATTSVEILEKPPYLAVINETDHTVSWSPSLNLVFFAGQDPYAIYTGKTGEVDFDQLFTAPSTWASGLSHVNVLLFYAQFWDQAPADKLKMVIDFANAHGLALAMEIGLEKVGTNGCGTGVEGYVTDGIPLRIAKKIAAAGGDLRYVSLDESFGANRNGTGCAVSAADSARQVIAKYKVMQTIFPELLIGDTENLPTGANPQWFSDYASWVDTFENESTSRLQFFHVDVDWANPGYNYSFASARAMLSSKNVPFGVIFNENAGVAADASSWTYSAIDNIRRYRQAGFTDPDHVVFQTWSAYSTQATPETALTAQTYLLPAYYSNVHNLYRFVNAAGAHSYSTTFSPSGFDRVSARFYTRNTGGLKPLYLCTGGTEWFLSGDTACENPGYTNNGVIGYLQPASGAGLVPVYRLYNAATGDRLFTTDLGEGAGFTNEGVLGYVASF